VQALQQELAATQARLEPLLPASERFERAAPNPAGERRIAADLDRVLGALDHVLECRGDTCRVQVVQRRGDKTDFWESLQSDEALAKKVHGQSFQAPRPAKDPVLGEPLRVFDAYLDLEATDVTSGLEVLEPLRALRNAWEVGACGRRFPDMHGDLDVQFDLQPEKGIDIIEGGSLAGTPAGICLDVVVRNAVSRIKLPPRYSPALVNLALTL
jgi:hypothetical protein